MSKLSRRRPRQSSRKDFDNSWDRIFSPKGESGDGGECSASIKERLKRTTGDPEPERNLNWEKSYYEQVKKIDECLP